MLFLGTPAYCQVKNSEDSIKNLLQQPQSDSVKQRLLIELGNIYLSVKPKQAIPCYAKAYALSFLPVSKNDNNKAIAAAKLIFLYQTNGGSQVAARWADSALALVKKVSDADVLARLYLRLADYYSMEERYQEALQIGQKMIKIFDSAGLPGKMGMAYLAHGDMYFKMEQDDKATDYYKKAISFTDKKRYPLTTDEDRQFITNAANVCLTQVYFELGKYDTALYYCERAYSGVVESNEIDRQCTMLQLKAIIYQELNRFAESVLPAKKAVDIAFKYDIGYQLYSSCSALAKAYAHIGNKDSALHYAQLCNNFAEKNIVNKEDWVDVYETWSDVYGALGDYKNAMLYKEKEMGAYKDYRDNEVNKAINRAEISFETKRKEQEISNLNELAKRQRIIQVSIGIALVFTLVAAIGFWLSYRNKRKAAAILEQSNKEKEVFLKEIHHRVKNNLQIISSLLYLQFKDNKDEKMIAALQQAQQRIKSMALVHNKLYEKQDVVHVYLKEYINDLAAGIIASNNPEGKAIKVSVTEDGAMALSLDTSISVGLILNELITNSCKYAFAGKAEGNINITLEQNDNRIKLHIADDGTGLPEGYEKKNSMGVRLVKNLARQLGGEASFASANGTAVTISFTETVAA